MRVLKPLDLPTKGRIYQQLENALHRIAKEKALRYEDMFGSGYASLFVGHINTITFGQIILWVINETRVLAHR